jgi:hypothetical protein
MNVPAIARIATLVVLATACGTGGPPTASQPPASSATSPPTANLPASPAAPSLEATVSPPTTSEPSSTTNPVQRLPPSAQLMSGGGHIVEGSLGSWCYDNACADKPAIPKDRLPKLPMQPDELLTFQLAEGHRFADVRVVYADEMDSADTHLLAAARPERPQRSFDFYPLPEGDWALWVSVVFPADGGDALYAWHVISESYEGTDPPTATLSGDGDAVAGQPGTYCYLDTCADGPWPRKADLPELTVASAASELTLTLAEPARFIGWSVAYGVSSNDDESTNLERGGSFDPDAPGPEYSEVTFAGPPAGDWVLFVWLTLRGGDLSYAWHLTVD